MRADAKEEAAASCGLSTVSSSTKSETFAVEMYLGPTVSAMKDSGTTQHPCSASHFMSPSNAVRLGAKSQRDSAAHERLQRKQRRNSASGTRLCVHMISIN